MYIGEVLLQSRRYISTPGSCSVLGKSLNSPSAIDDTDTQWHLQSTEHKSACRTTDGAQIYHQCQCYGSMKNPSPGNLTSDTCVYSTDFTPRWHDLAPKHRGVPRRRVGTRLHLCGCVGAIRSLSLLDLRTRVVVHPHHHHSCLACC